MTVSPLDFVQTRWPVLIAAICALSAMVALLCWHPSQLWLVYVMATAFTCWNVRAYAKGKRLQVSPGLSAQANDSMARRRTMLACSICLYLLFTALAVYSGLSTAN